MARLPIPGNDNGTWGNVLNDFLNTVHQTDGTLKDNVVSAAALAPDAVDATNIQDATISEDKLDSALASKVNNVGTVPNGSITPAKLNSDVPGSGEVLSYNGTGFEWITPAGAAPVLSVNNKTGAVTLVPGDIAGFAAVATSGAYNDLTGKPAAAIPLTSQATWPIVPAAVTATVDYNTGSSSYPARPTSRTDIVVRWRGPVAPTVGGSGAVDNVDEWVNTP
jgi:hypothetical protein